MYDSLYPNTQMRFLCADYIPSQVEAVEAHLQSLIYPKSSHMDFNIACALHLISILEFIYEFEKQINFASKCEGYAFKEDFFTEEFQHKFDEVAGGFDTNKSIDRSEEVKKGNTKAKSYDFGLFSSAVANIDPALYRDTDLWLKSESKVVFSGLGADEVFGGYARYKTAFERGGVQEMEQEMSMDLDRLWHRNMGRDDRAISDNGKETRFPYLDTNLMKYLGSNFETKDLVDFSALRGVGDKMLLRRVASEDFGIRFASGVEKRAIQFGTKIGKQTNVKKFGSNRKANGKAQYQKK